MDGGRTRKPGVSMLPRVGVFKLSFSQVFHDQGNIIALLKNPKAG